MAYNNLNFAIYSRTFGTLNYESKREKLPCSFLRQPESLKFSLKLVAPLTDINLLYSTNIKI